MTSSTKQEQNLIEIYRNKKAFGVVDAIIIAILVVAIVVSCVFLFSSNKGAYVVVYENGKESARYSLENNLTTEILDGKMLLKIENSSCRVLKSDCKNQICVRSNAISNVGERIVCAPNKVSIVIRGKSNVIITGGEL